MISWIEISHFKSLREVKLELGPLNFFIGTNASGKSNFFDALRVLQGIGYGFTFDEILNGKPKTASSEVWDGVRGGSAKALFNGENDASIGFKIGIFHGKRSLERLYGIAFDPNTLKLKREVLPGEYSWVSHPSASSVKVEYYARPGKGKKPHLDYEIGRPVLGQFAKDRRVDKNDQAVALRLINAISNVQRLDLVPNELREYSQVHNIKRIGEHGENFAALVRTICEDERAKQAFVTWLKELRPAEVDDVGILKGAVGESMFMIHEGCKEYPAPVLSDGTLRFAAMTSAFFQPDMPAIMMIEEIENGIHASRLRLLVELMRTHAQEGSTQVFVTTHSPVVLAWLKEEEYKHVFFCKRDEASGESIIKPVTEIPRFLETVRKQPFGDLFTEGWLESAL